MDDRPSRPDAASRASVLRGGLSAMVWIGAAVLVGFIGVTTVVRLQDRSGGAPPTSMFAAVGIALSVIALLTVTGATRRAGAPWRAAIAFGGGFAAIMIAKCAIGPTALFQGNATEDIQSLGGLRSGGLILDIGI